MAATGIEVPGVSSAGNGLAIGGLGAGPDTLTLKSAGSSIPPLSLITFLTTMRVAVLGVGVNGGQKVWITI